MQLLTEPLFHGGDKKATAAAFKMPEESLDPHLVLDDDTMGNVRKGEMIPVEDNSDLLR